MPGPGTGPRSGCWETLPYMEPTSSYRITIDNHFSPFCARRNETLYFHYIPSRYYPTIYAYDFQAICLHVSLLSPQHSTDDPSLPCLPGACSSSFLTLLLSIHPNNDGFGGLVVSMLASGNRVRGFKPGRSRWIFRASENSSACLPSEEKWKNLSHVPALRHVKEPSTSVNYECASKIPSIVLFFANRGVSCLCGAWRLWR